MKSMKLSLQLKTICIYCYLEATKKFNIKDFIPKQRVKLVGSLRLIGYTLLFPIIISGASCKTISYPLFADADTGIYPHAALQYQARPKAKRGIAMLSVDKFPYPRKQTRGNEFIPCSNNICDILKRFRSFKIPAITLIWPKSPYKHSVTRSYRSCKESGRRSESPLWRHQWRSFVFISHADDVKREIRLHISRLLSNQKRESARSMG